MTVDVHWWTGPRPGGRWHRADVSRYTAGHYWRRTLCGADITAGWTWADAPTIDAWACTRCAAIVARHEARP